MRYPNIKTELEKEINKLNSLDKINNFNFKKNSNILLNSDLDNKSFPLIKFYEETSVKKKKESQKNISELELIRENIKKKSNSYLLSLYNKNWLKQKLYSIENLKSRFKKDLEEYDELSLKLLKLKADYRYIENKINS